MKFLKIGNDFVNIDLIQAINLRENEDGSVRVNFMHDQNKGLGVVHSFADQKSAVEFYKKNLDVELTFPEKIIEVIEVKKPIAQKEEIEEPRKLFQNKKKK